MTPVGVASGVLTAVASAKTVSRTIVLLALTGAVAAAQQDASDVVLRGVVVTDNDVPLAHVRVALLDSSEPPILTDERGQFTLHVPESGAVRLAFTKARYGAVRLEVPRSDRGSRDVVGLRVRLSLGAVISGYVRDRSGEPVLQALVTARRPGVASALIPTVVATTTDDLGEFRFAGLDPGAYVVRVSRVQAGAERNMPETFDEHTVNVGGGEEIGLDLRIDMPSELARYPQGYSRPPGPDATASLRGRVTTPQGAPLAGALVQVRGPGGLTQAETDARGRYVIDRLAPGEYRIEAIKRGFSPIARGGQNALEMLLRQAPPEDRTILLRAGEATSPIDLTLGRGASVVGTIVDEFGEPLQGIRVHALQLRPMGGRIRAIPVSLVSGGAQTDDRGRYRLFGLQPGRYVIRAMADAMSATAGYVPVFYPGTPAIDLATPTTLEADANVPGVDFTFLPEPSRRIRGIVLDSRGEPVRAAVTLVSRGGSGAIQAEPVLINSNVDGSFSFNGVAPGDYVVQAMATGPAEPDARVTESRWLAAAVVAAREHDPAPLAMTLLPGATLTGRVVFEGVNALPPPYSGIELRTVSADPDSRLLLDASSRGFALLMDNSFEYRGVFGSNSLTARVSYNPDWYVKSITYRGQDLTDSAFDFGMAGTFRDIEVVVSGAGAAVSGRVFDERAAPVHDYAVAVFSADRSRWTVASRWLRTSRASSDGTFRLTGLVPGDYWVVAVDQLDGSDVAGDLQSPEILDALASRAARVTLGEGQAQDLSLRLVRR